MKAVKFQEVEDSIVNHNNLNILIKLKLIKLTRCVLPIKQPLSGSRTQKGNYTCVTSYLMLV
jgi:hypothetical protein